MLVPVPMSVQVAVAALVASQVVAVAMAVLGAVQWLRRGETHSFNYTRFELHNRLKSIMGIL